MTAFKTAMVILNDEDVRKAIAQYIGRELGLEQPPCSPGSINIAYYHNGMTAWSDEDCKFRVAMTVNI